MKKYCLILFLLPSLFCFGQTDSVTTDAALWEKAYKQLEKIRNDIIAGTISFGDAAKIHSRDPGSASNGGLYTKISKGTFVPEFEAVAYKVNVGEVSPIFKTQFGYHILMIDARRGDEIDVRHILISPK